MFKIVFDNAARDAARLSALDKQIITDCATKADVPFVVVTSTARSPEEQALAMYRNCVAQGPASQKKLYGAYGDLCISVFEDCQQQGITSEAQIVTAMTRMIKQIGPGRVSRHCTSSWEKLHVIDISYLRVPKENRANFHKALETDRRISKVLTPLNSSDPCFHVEIPQAA